MKVCIAEKPSVARDIAKVIGADVAHNGYMEGNGYQVTWTFGHLCTLHEPQDYTNLWKSWSLASLPMIPPQFRIKLIDDSGVKKQFAIIEELMQHADEIINCGDAGQEGELIQRWVMQRARAKCPVKRLWISSLTEDAIRDGFSHLKDQSEYQSLYEAGMVRAIGDWLLGMNATRLYTLKYGQNRQVLSIGRVQTPTLAMIVTRQLQIENFVPEQYWVLSTVYREIPFTATSGKINTQEEGQRMMNEIKDSPFVVSDVTAKKGTEAPPRLFDLTSLQVECNKKYAFSADKTLQIIQSLYEKKFTTYPRVDTTYLSDDIYAKCPQIMGGLAGISTYVPLLEPFKNKKLPKSKKVFDSSKVTDHHAIIPTGVTPYGMTDDEEKVFNLVARRFIAAFYPDCQFTTTTVLGKVETHEFKATGKVIVDAGWRVVFGNNVQDEDDKKDDEEKTLPAFVKGESGPHKPELAEKWTQPPKPYTEATLLRAMETAGKSVDNEELRDALKENGIGRPSTRAAIIETLFKRRYIIKEKKNLIATQTGIELIQLIHEESLKSAELTGVWEKKLREIEHKTYNAKQFLDELKQMVTDIVQTVIRDNTNRRIALTEVKEPEKDKKTKQKTPRQQKDKKKPEGVSVETKPNDSIIGTECPLCRKGKIIKGNTAYGCSEYKNGCTYRIPFV